MCQTIIITNRNNLELETVSQLQKEIPNLKLIKNEMYGVLDVDNCLRQLELDFMFDNARIDYELDCMEYKIKI